MSMDEQSPLLINVASDLKHGEMRRGMSKRDELSFKRSQKVETDTGPFRSKAGKSLMIATIFTLFFMVVEIVGGAIANSLAIMTDAAHLLTDVGAMLLSLFAMHLAARPADQRLTFGYHRAEILGALASIVTIWVLVGILCYEAVQRFGADTGLFNQESVADLNGFYMTIIGTAGFFVNIIDAFILRWGNAPHGHSHGGGGHGHSHGGAKKPKPKDEISRIEEGKVGGKKKKKKKKTHEQNVNVRAAFIHVVGDCLQSLGVIAAALVVWLGNYFYYGNPYGMVQGSYFNLADPIASLLFGVVTLGTTVKLCRNVVDILMEKVPDHIDYNAIKAGLEAIDGVENIHDLHVWSLSMGKVSLSVHIDSYKHAEALSNAQKVCLAHGITHTTIQVDTPEDICSTQEEYAHDDLT